MTSSLVYIFRTMAGWRIAPYGKAHPIQVSFRMHLLSTNSPSSITRINLVIIFTSMGFVAHSPPNIQAAMSSLGPNFKPGAVFTEKFGKLPLFSQVNGIMNMVFAYGGAMIFPEMVCHLFKFFGFFGRNDMEVDKLFFFLVFVRLDGGDEETDGFLEGNGEYLSSTYSWLFTPFKINPLSSQTMAQGLIFTAYLLYGAFIYVSPSPSSSRKSNGTILLTQLIHPTS